MGERYLFLLPLLIGFACNLASAFTGAYSRKWGGRTVSLLTILVREVLGIPIWGSGFALAAVAASPPFLSPAHALCIPGWFLIAAGAAVIIAALAVLRRRSFAPTADDALADRGIYARVRHPIHSGTLLEFLGLVLVRPNLAMVLACGLGAIWVWLQTRFEERDLLRRIPGYREYMNRVPRFFPRLGKP
jgi:protein-S-isoprenylcysteine O-methyltransferase Ste14